MDLHLFYVLQTGPALPVRELSSCLGALQPLGVIQVATLFTNQASDSESNLATCATMTMIYTTHPLCSVGVGSGDRRIYNVPMPISGRGVYACVSLCVHAEMYVDAGTHDCVGSTHIYMWLHPHWSNAYQRQHDTLSDIQSNLLEFRWLD